MAALDRISIAAIGDTPAELAEQAGSAEVAGIDCVWTPELFRSSVTQATWLAARTEKVDVGTGIAWAFTRSAFIMAVSALDIDEMSGGRFRLGLGAGVRRLNETWHSVDYGKPAPHLRETIEATRLIMEKASAGEPIRYDGEYHDIDIRGWVRPHKPARERVPIYAAAMREGMCRMAGDVADGLIGHPMCPVRWIDEVVVPSFETGLSRSGRGRSDLDFIPTITCAIDDDEARALDAARRTIAFYSTVRTYKPLWEMHGFAEAAQARWRCLPQGRPRRRPGADPGRDGRGLQRGRPARQGPGSRRRGR
jgi:alkanesulfonate monooxygenase SsuD/methylene tetrahydromethanopterin reductase-like flavin-dependent oxidoreductase (luciferase family)